MSIGSVAARSPSDVATSIERRLLAIPWTYRLGGDILRLIKKVGFRLTTDLGRAT